MWSVKVERESHGRDFPSVKYVSFVQLNGKSSNNFLRYFIPTLLSELGFLSLYPLAILIVWYAIQVGDPCSIPQNALILKVMHSYIHLLIVFAHCYAHIPEGKKLPQQKETKPNTDCFTQGKKNAEENNPRAEEASEGNFLFLGSMQPFCHIFADMS